MLPKNSKKSIFCDDFTDCFASDKSLQKRYKSSLKRVFAITWSGNCILVFLCYQILRKKFEKKVKILKKKNWKFWEKKLFFSKSFSFSETRHFFCATNHILERRERDSIQLIASACIGGNNMISEAKQMHEKNAKQIWLDYSLYIKSELNWLIFLMHFIARSAFYVRQRQRGGMSPNILNKDWYRIRWIYKFQFFWNLWSEFDAFRGQWRFP